MIGVVSITDNSRGAKERTAQVDQDNLAAEAAMARLEADFTQIWSPLYFTQKFTGSLDPNTNPAVVETVYLYERHPRLRLPSKEGLPIPIFRSKEKTEFVFLTTANRRRLENQKQSQFMWVRYYLGEPPVVDEAVAPRTGSAAVSASATKALLRQVWADDPWSKEELDFEDTRSAVLLEKVEKVEFKFWNPQTKKWESSLTSMQDGELLQRGLQIALTWYDSQGHKRETVRSMRPLWPAVAPQDTAVAGGANSGFPNGGGTPAGGNGGLGPDGLPLNDESEP